MNISAYQSKWRFDIIENYRPTSTSRRPDVGDKFPHIAHDRDFIPKPFTIDELRKDTSYNAPIIKPNHNIIIHAMKALE